MKPITRQRGLSLVELLVGLALGLFIVAVAATLLAAQTQGQRRLATEHRLMQDLRTATDVIGRDLRRAGHWGAAASGVWMPAASGTAANPYAALGPASAASDAASWRYSRDAIENQAVDANEQFGLRLRNGAIELALGAGQWQSLTDAGTLVVTGFEVMPRMQTIELGSHCDHACAPGDTSCPPRLQVRRLGIAITARASSDAAVERSLRSEIRVRNDAVTGACPA
jgi:prepilin peptidase dependent protein B